MTDELEKAEPSALVQTVVDQPMDFTIVARSPEEMVTAQRSMTLWAARKIQGEKELLADAEENLAVAKKNKWKTTSWYTRAAMSRKKIDFYKKVKAALEAGYYIVPPFPIDVFAIRTARKSPKDQVVWDYQKFSAEMPDLLPAGEGRYVQGVPGSFGSEDQKEWNSEKNAMVSTGRKVRRPSYYNTVDFPFKLAMPAVLNETARAMALKVFDQLGILPQRAAMANPDPMILGQILMPHKRNAPLTFFVAWWLDTRTI